MRVQGAQAPRERSTRPTSFDGDLSQPVPLARQLAERAQSAAPQAVEPQTFPMIPLLRVRHAVEEWAHNPRPAQGVRAEGVLRLWLGQVPKEHPAPARAMPHHACLVQDTLSTALRVHCTRSSALCPAAAAGPRAQPAHVMVCPAPQMSGLETEVAAKVFALPAAPGSVQASIAVTVIGIMVGAPPAAASLHLAQALALRQDSCCCQSAMQQAGAHGTQGSSTALLAHRLSQQRPRLLRRPGCRPGRWRTC